MLQQANKSTKSGFIVQKIGFLSPFGSLIAAVGQRF
jgi:hypothetical protein